MRLPLIPSSFYLNRLPVDTLFFFLLELFWKKREKGEGRREALGEPCWVGAGGRAIPAGALGEPGRMVLAAGSRRAEVTDKPAGLAACIVAGEQHPLPGALVT